MLHHANYILGNSNSFTCVRWIIGLEATMFSIVKTFIGHNRVIIPYMIAFALLVQGTLGAGGSCMMIMDDTGSEQAHSMSHDGEGASMHEGHNHKSDQITIDSTKETNSKFHKCPPNGCDICEGQSCSQCSPSQFSAIIEQDVIFPKAPRQLIPEMARLAAFIVSLRQWSMPPGRGPPEYS